MRKLTLALTMIALACGGGSSSGSDKASAKSADGLSEVPNIAGVRVKVPDGAQPNGIGGAAGFHTEDDSFGFTLMDADPAKDIEQAKKDAEELFFKKWIKSEKTDDGWVLTYESSKIDVSGDEAKEVGTMYSFEVRKKVGDKDLKCYGAVAKAEQVDPVVQACQSLTAG